MAGPGHKRTPRTIEIADHLWERMEAMALEMGAEPDTLVNQALHAFAREHGYLKPGELALSHAVPPPPTTQRAPEMQRGQEETTQDPIPDLKVAEAAAMRATGSGGPRVTMQPMSRSAAEGPTGLTAQLYRANERPDRSSTNKMRPVKEPKPSPVAPPPPEPEPPADEPETQSKVDAGPVPDPDYLPNEVTGSEISALPSQKPAPKGGGDRTVVGKAVERTLFIIVDGKNAQPVQGARFVIGRDPACQLALPSNRISRQHVAVLKDSTGAVIEDLGSSNGTWFKNERIGRRPVLHGDEYTIGDIVLRFEYRETR